jgi:hypothetical protein
MTEDEAWDELERRQNRKPMTTPHKREWVGLSDEERRYFASWLDFKTDDEVFNAIEAKLKEKNGF